MRSTHHGGYRRHPQLGVEELVRLRYEPPKFDHLLRMAYKARKKNTNIDTYAAVSEAIPEITSNQLENLLNVD